MQSDSKLVSSTAAPPQQASENSRILKQSFTSLTDAMRFAYHKEQLQGKIQEMEAKSAKGLADLDELSGKIEALVRSLGGGIDQDALNELSTQISGFSHLAIEQTKAKVEQKNQAGLSEFRASWIPR